MGSNGETGRTGRKVFLSAGEASGDLHGSYLVEALRDLDPGIRVSCLGGRRLRQAGARVMVDNGEVAVVGLFEVLSHTKAIYAALRKIGAYMERERPDLVILIDFPDFNFLLARIAKRLGIRVFYYISPQVWAWRSGRARTLKRLADGMAVILPFEPAFYERYGMKVHYVGHPLLDVLADAPSREEAELKYRGNPSGGPLIGLLPGSRLSEIKSLLPLMLGAGRLIHSQQPDASFLLPVASSLNPDPIRVRAAASGLPVRIVSDDAYGAIRACDLVIAASGTVTLETAILGTPMIITYKVSGLTYHLGRNLIRVKHVGMPNVIAGRRIVPELLQNEAVPERIASEALAFLRAPQRLEEQRRELRAIRGHLGTAGVARRVARLALELMK